VQYLSPSVGLSQGSIARRDQHLREHMTSTTLDKYTSRGLTLCVEDVVVLFGNRRAECKYLFRHDVERWVARPIIKFVAQRGKMITDLHAGRHSLPPGTTGFSEPWPGLTSSKRMFIIITKRVINHRRRQKINVRGAPIDSCSSSPTCVRLQRVPVRVTFDPCDTPSPATRLRPGQGLARAPCRQTDQWVG
jgi:hypothetical protein